MNLVQLRDFIVDPVLRGIGAYSPAAMRLVIGTGLVESGFEWVQQVGGPAAGFWQMEPKTHDDIHRHFLAARPRLRTAVMLLAAPGIELSAQLRGNLFYAAALCRVHYLRVPEPMPEAENIEALGRYWKAHYNTPSGKGTVEGFCRKAAAIAEL